VPRSPSFASPSVLIDQPSENRSQRDGGQVRPPRSPDSENLRNTAPDDREASYRPAGDGRDYDSGSPRGADTKFQTGTGAYRDSADRQARSPAPNGTTNGPSKFSLNHGPPSLDDQGSSVNESDLDEDYDDRLGGNTAGKGPDPATTLPSYLLRPNPNHKQREPTVAINQDPYKPYSEFMNRDMSVR
jgi:hypothetical protein